MGQQKMATAAPGSKRAYKQDLPPKGGYAPFNYHRIPARKMYTAPLLFGGFILWEIWAHWRYRRGRRLLQADETEERSTHFALEPLMLAERDRIFIKQLKQNRDYEEKLMKDVKNKYPIVPWQEYYTHARPGGVNAEIRHREW